MRNVLRPVGSVEKLDATLEAGAVLAGTVRIALVDANGVETWNAAEWVSDSTDSAGVVSNFARTTSAITFDTLGRYVVRIEATATPEVPTRDCYTLKVHP